MHKIYIVDDSKVSRKVLRELLENAGYEVIGEAVNGQEIVDRIKECKPDLITLDITMPVKTGIEALKEIKEISPETKVIMVSAAGQKDKIMEAIKAGASDFIQKPYEADKIISAINKIMNKCE